MIQVATALSRPVRALCGAQAVLKGPGTGRSRLSDPTALGTFAHSESNPDAHYLESHGELRP